MFFMYSCLLEGDLLFVQINIKQILDKFLMLSKGSDSKSTWVFDTIFDLALIIFNQTILKKYQNLTIKQIRY
jgi:hypothetical protein